MNSSAVFDLQLIFFVTFNVSLKNNIVVSEQASLCVYLNVHLEM